MFESVEEDFFFRLSIDERPVTVQLCSMGDVGVIEHIITYNLAYQTIRKFPKDWIRAQRRRRYPERVDQPGMKSRYRRGDTVTEPDGCIQIGDCEYPCKVQYQRIDNLRSRKGIRLKSNNHSWAVVEENVDACSQMQLGVLVVAPEKVEQCQKKARYQDQRCRRSLRMRDVVLELGDRFQILQLGMFQIVSTPRTISEQRTSVEKMLRHSADGDDSVHDACIGVTCLQDQLMCMGRGTESKVYLWSRLAVEEVEELLLLWRLQNSRTWVSDGGLRRRDHFGVEE